MEILKRVVSKSFKRFIGKWVDQIFFQRKLMQATPILVYQMGKVGSTSIYRSLLEQYAGAVVNSHSFSSTHNDPKIRRLYHSAIVTARPLNIISLVREPIGRNVSAFFQNFERDTRVPYTEANFSIEELKATFLSNYAHDNPLNWFDNNIMANFGIDVFSTPFPENGISTYSQNGVRLLVMRLEIDDKDKVAAINDFLGLADFQLHNLNIGDEKDYSSTYKNFKNKVKFSPDYVDKMWESKYFNHFYGKDTINKSREKWSERQ